METRLTTATWSFLRTASGLPSAFQMNAGKGEDIWLYDVARGLRTRFTFDPSNVFGSIWSPDGSRIVFNSHRKGSFDLYQKASSGAGSEEVLLEDNLDKYPDSWSPDGRFILYESLGSSRNRHDLFVLPLTGDRKPYPFLQTQFNEADGRILSGRPMGRVPLKRVWQNTKFMLLPFRALAGSGRSRRPAVTFRDGVMTALRSSISLRTTELMVAAVNGKGASFEVGAVKPLFRDAHVAFTGVGYQYDVSADGQRFLINTSPEQATSAPITVVLNWTAGLKK